MYPRACVLHVEIQSAIGFFLNWITSILLYWFIVGLLLRSRQTALPFLNSLRSTSLIQQYAAPDSLLRLD